MDNQPTPPPPSSLSAVKPCRKCGNVLPATTQFFYRNAGGKFGLTPRCKRCVNDDNRAAFQARRLNDPETVLAQQRARTRRWYYADVERARALHRDAQKRYRADPAKKAKINARKRAGGAGLTPEQIAHLLAEQGGRCGICGAADPGGKTGWNVDHCHSSGRIRFILCSHCNRGLGAFKDDPQLMRTAADALEKWMTENAT